jgi:hypothetical protein
LGILLSLPPTESKNWKTNTMKKIPKPTTDEALIQQFLDNGGSVSVGKTKPLPSELGLSNNSWNVKLTKEEKSAKNAK